MMIHGRFHCDHGIDLNDDCPGCKLDTHARNGRYFEEERLRMESGVYLKATNPNFISTSRYSLAFDNAQQAAIVKWANSEQCPMCNQWTGTRIQEAGAYGAYGAYCPECDYHWIIAYPVCPYEKTH